MLAPETILQGRYRILKQLGQGGMGAVYEAVDERLDTTVALKETLFADERLRKQFEREARLLARMHHPALPRVSDHFSENEGQFLVMQFIGGDDLAAMMAARRSPFPADQVLNWADQLLDALDYLHTQTPQIIHRDIKPQNLKLTTRGQIILLDFGLAKGQAAEISRVTTSASIYGYTPNYAPLEQIQGLGTDARSDLYALAATLYHLITGVKPPDALTRAAAIVNGQADPLKPANEVNSELAAEVAAVLERALAQNREQRYPSAAAMRKALHGSGEGATVSNRSEADTVLFPPSEATVVATTGPHQETAARTTKVEPATPATRADLRQATRRGGETTVVRPPAPAKSNAHWTIAAVALVFLAVCACGYYLLRQRSNAESVTLTAPASTPNDAVAQPTSSAPVETPTQELRETPQATNETEAEKVARKSEKAARAKERVAEEKAAEAQRVDEALNPSTAHEVHPENDRPPEPVPEEPDVDLSGVPRMEGPRRGRQRPGGVTVRNLPDGSQLIMTPDGTRILVRPDGTRRVLRPGERLNRRRAMP